MEAGSINVIYIAAAGRSGSTLLGRALGMAPDAKNFNELRPVWKKGFIDNQMCSCGERFNRCAFWKLVVDDIQASTSKSPEEIYLLHREVDTMKEFVPYYFGFHSPVAGSNKDHYLQLLTTLYHSLAAHSNAHVVIDSSKTPIRGLLLSKCSDFRLNLIHLLRHPAGVAFSWKNSKVDPGSGEVMPRYSVVRSCLRWLFMNIAIIALSRRCSTVYMEYEHFCRSPQVAMNFLESQIDCIGNLGTTESSTLSLPDDHSLSGNPDRFVSGPTNIVQDNRWKAGLPWFEKLFVWISCAPLYYFIRRRARKQRGYFGDGRMTPSVGA